MNNRFKSFLLAAALPCMALAQQSDNYRSEVWSPDNGDGTYTNPVINADYSDPDVCVVGNDYYLTASSFQCIPGLRSMNSRLMRSSTGLRTAMGCGRPVYVTTTASSISIGATRIMGSSW